MLAPAGAVAATVFGLAGDAGGDACTAASSADDWWSCAAATGTGEELQCEARKRPPAIKKTPMPAMYHWLSVVRIAAHIDHSPEEPILARPELSTWTSSEQSGRYELSPRQTLMQVNKINSQKQSRDSQINCRRACGRQCRERRSTDWASPRRAATSPLRAAAAALRARAMSGTRP
jgi:hypothetical protein